MNVNQETGEMVAVPSMNALVSAEQQRAIAEVQAAMILARMNPRDQVRAETLILKDCERATFVETALYAYARGGSDIVGLSIHAAQAMAQRWGNIQWGTRELEQRDGESVMQSYAWDLETNAKSDKVFVVPHVRETRTGTVDLVSPRDIYELTANQGSRRTRACLLAVIPDELADKARRRIEDTLLKTAAPTPERVEKMLAFFAGFGITLEQVEKLIQRKTDAMKPIHMARLIKIANSLRDGMSSPGDWFQGASKVVAMPRAKTTEPVATEAPTPAAATSPAATTPATPARALANGGSAPAPATTQAPSAASSAPAYDWHHVASIDERKDSAGRIYSLVTTRQGLKAHALDPTVVADAREAMEDGAAVRFEGKPIAFPAAPYRIKAVIRQVAERMPGEEG